MSSAFYDNIWHYTQKNLETLAIKDFEYQSLDPVTERAQAQDHTFELYLRYIGIANELEEIYDKIIQPQKRLLVRKLLDATLGRVVELKHDLVNIDIMEFSYNDKVVSKLKITPMDMEIHIPKYFIRDRLKEIQDRKQTMEDILQKLGWIDENQPEEQLTEIEAIRIIQVHERARQGRLRAHFMKEIRTLKDKGKSDSRSGAESGLIAALKIQKLWRGHVARRKTRRRKIEEMILIGMIPSPSNVKKPLETVEKMNKVISERYDTQKEYREKFEAALKDIKEEIKTKQGPSLTEDIADHIRAWIRDFHEKTGKFPDFPSEESGGSRHIFSRPGTESEMSRSSAKSSSKESKKTKDKSKSPARSGDLNIDDNLENGFRPTQSVFLPDLKTGIEEFNDTWKDKDESENFKQNHYEEMIYAEKYTEVEREIRKVVDDLMRQELELLQQALDRDRAAKGKKPKKASKKTRRSGKKSKKKKEKDLTPDRTTESLFEELVTNGIIRKYPDTLLKNYLGDKAYVERNGANPTPGDIRQLLIEYAILPLGSETIRNFCPLIRSMLLAGPKGTGKKTLVHAICTEVGAVLFDITPTNIVGKYPGKSGLIMLIHLVLKVSRLLQPSVIFMGDAERPFMKKIPKTDRSDPKRLKKDLQKIVKNIAIEDRVIFIGTSNLPWEADQKLLQQCYNRFIYIPRPDYGALSFAWKQLIQESTGGIQPQFDYSSMAKISDGYTIGSIVACLEEVMTCKRKLQLRTQPLNHVELINALCIRDPVYKEEDETFISWWSRTPLGRRRQKALDMEEAARLEEAAQAAKAGGGVGSKKKKTPPAAAAVP